jgi:hypothetical protein
MRSSRLPSSAVSARANLTVVAPIMEHFVIRVEEKPVGSDTDVQTPRQQTLNDTMNLARVIADLCLTSGLKSHGAVECALDIDRRLVEANMLEQRLRRESLSRPQRIDSGSHGISERTRSLPLLLSHVLVYDVIDRAFKHMFDLMQRFRVFPSKLCSVSTYLKSLNDSVNEIASFIHDPQTTRERASKQPSFMVLNGVEE